MSIRLTNLITILVVSASSSVFAIDAIAQTQATDYQPIPLETLPEVIERAHSHESGTALTDWKILPQLNTLFGWGSFSEGSYPENEIARDAKLINILHQDFWEQQVSSDPIIRTLDLKNPFDSSLRQNPSYYTTSPPMVGSELVYERRPLR